MATVKTAWDQVSSNIFKTWLIMFLFAFFVVGIVYLFALGFGYDQTSALSLVGFALILTGIMNFGSYYYSDSIVLGISGAKLVKKEDNPQLFRTVENLCIAAGLPTPKIYIMDDNAPNAFATGRDAKHAAICFTSGILERLDKQELEGVTAHELSHIGNRDTLLMAVVAILVGMIAILANIFMRSLWFRGGDREERQGGGLMMIIAIIAAIFAPIAATLIQLAVSRRRELLADASGVLLTRYPEGLENALMKISDYSRPVQMATPGTAHLFIVNPLGLASGRSIGGWFTGLFDTHPPIKDRIKALQQMEGKI